MGWPFVESTGLEQNHFIILSRLRPEWLRTLQARETRGRDWETPLLREAKGSGVKAFIFTSLKANQEDSFTGIYLCAS